MNIQLSNNKKTFVLNMKYIPILFSTKMVQAIFEGFKTKTRRVITEFPECLEKKIVERTVHALDSIHANVRCRYGKPGDILWVRETFANLNIDFSGVAPYYVYKSDLFHEDQHGPVTWKPSIHMPKEACRLFLKVKSVRVERLHDISEEDAIAEGVHKYDDGTFKNYFKKKGWREIDGIECLSARASFETLWSSINGTRSWNSNPWVWLIEFERIEKPLNWPL